MRAVVVCIGGLHEVVGRKIFDLAIITDDKIEGTVFIAWSQWVLRIAPYKEYEVVMTNLMNPTFLKSVYMEFLHHQGVRHFQGQICQMLMFPFDSELIQINLTKSIKED